MNENVIPKTAQQAFKILDQMLSSEEKQRILSKSQSEFCAEEHFALGLWIRNNWIFADTKLIGLFAPNPEACQTMVYPPDYLSDEFLKKYYKHLQRSQKK